MLNLNLSPKASRFIFFIGTVMFAVNHGSALLKGKMNLQRWISASFGYKYLLFLCCASKSYLKPILIHSY